MPDTPPPPRLPAILRAVGRAWFVLTTEEQRAVLLILALLALGVLVRLWHALAVP